ncbi:hypothetical protein I0P70_09350 [Pontibacter sp. FD36]|uniref:hypothetical protein n=1 Tax=Pontibacter sp. FD36 TaxID=2789860 RepID=UPI0018A9982E|nr:hypothetical protein [Pontibacter sp. FD36]MBF8963451.1 hypothetical protein [Pontibacter sp. FD36]
MVVLRTKEALIEGRHLPEFELNQGELMSLLVESLEFELILKDYLTGKKQNPNVELLKSFVFVEHTSFKVTLIDRLLGRDLVRHLVQKEFKDSNQTVESIMEKAQVSADWRIRGLAGNPRRILATLMALEHSSCIIYDVTGMDPLGAERLHQIVQEEIKTRGGAAIEMNVPTFNGKRFLPKADKLVEIKMPNHNKV